MIKANGHKVEIKGTLGDVMSEIGYIIDDFIGTIPKDSEDDRKASSRAYKSLIFLANKKAEKAGLSTRLTKEEKKEFEDAWEKSKKETEELMSTLKKSRIFWASNPRIPMTMTAMMMTMRPRMISQTSCGEVMTWQMK